MDKLCLLYLYVYIIYIYIIEEMLWSCGQLHSLECLRERQMVIVKNLYYVFRLPMLPVSFILVMLWVLQLRMHLYDGKHSAITLCVNYQQLKLHCIPESNVNFARNWTSTFLMLLLLSPSSIIIFQCSEVKLSAAYVIFTCWLLYL